MAQIIIYGDSITEGYWDSQGGWADRIKRDLFAKPVAGKTPYHAIYNLGISGDTLNDVAMRVESELLPRMYPNEQTIIVIAAGINDTRSKDTEDNVISTPEVYRADLELLSEQIIGTIGLPNLIFVGLTPVDEAKTSPTGSSYYSNERIRMFDDVLLSFCNEFEFLYVPLFDAFMEAGAAKLLNADGLHPNDKGHELIQKLVKEQLDKFLV